MRSLPPHLAAADLQRFQPPPQFQLMSPGRLPPQGDLPLPRRRQTSRDAAAAATSASFWTPRQTRQPSAEVFVKPRASAWGGRVGDHGSNDDFICLR